MPYASDKQRRWAHTDTARRKGFPTAEFDAEERMHTGKKKKPKKKKRADPFLNAQMGAVKQKPY